MPEVYSDLKKSQQISKEIASLESKVQTFTKAETSVSDLMDLVELSEMENDESMVEFIQSELVAVEKVIEENKIEITEE